jgi:hypothetical protein
MDVSIGEVQARVESNGAESASVGTTPDAGKKLGRVEKAHEMRLQQRRAKRIHERLCAM